MKTYLRHRIRNVVDVKELTALERLDFEGKYKNYEEKHDFWEMCFVLKGKVILFLENEKFEILPNELVLISPDTKHSYSSSDGNKTSAFVVCFDCPSSSVKALAKRVIPLSQEQCYSIKKIIEESDATFRMNENEHLEVLKDAVFGGEEAIILQLEYLLITLLRLLSVEKESPIEFLNGESFHHDLAYAVLDYLKESVYKKISLDEICNKFNYSRSFLCKIFKEETGESLISAFNRLKVEEAMKMLSKTDASVQDVAFTFGFKEVKYFDVVFKKVTGITPLLYRKKGEKR